MSNENRPFPRLDADATFAAAMSLMLPTIAIWFGLFFCICQTFLSHWSWVIPCLPLGMLAIGTIYTWYWVLGGDD